MSDIFEEVAPLEPLVRRGYIDVALDQLDGHPGTYRVLNDFGFSYKSWGDVVRRRGWQFITREKATELYVVVPAEQED